MVIECLKRVLRNPNVHWLEKLVLSLAYLSCVGMLAESLMQLSDGAP